MNIRFHGFTTEQLGGKVWLYVNINVCSYQIEGFKLSLELLERPTVEAEPLVP